MKYLKIFALALGALAMASCSNDNDKPKLNTESGIVVSMAQDQITVRENKGIITVPVKITGETNGYMVATCNVAEVGSNPAMEDVHYLMTAKSIVIEAGATEAAFELRLVDDKEPNEPREFVLTLETIEGGAELGAPLQTIVTITDNDSEPYDRLGGEWQIIVNGSAKGTANFESYEPGEAGYNEFYSVTGICGTTPLKANFDFNKSTKVATITFEYGDIEVTKDGNVYPGYFCYLEGGYIKDSGTIRFEWNSEENPDEIELVSSMQDGFADFVVVYNPGDGWYLDARTEGVTGFHKQ